MKRPYKCLALLPACLLLLNACSDRNVLDTPQRTAPPAQQQAAAVATEAPTEAPEDDSGLLTIAELMGTDALPDEVDIPAEDDTAADEELPDDRDIPADIAEPDEAPSQPTAPPTATPQPGPTAVNPFATAVPEGEGEGDASVSTAVKDFTYVTLTDPSFGFVMNYPDDWVNLPGKFTVCFEEPEPTTAFPARVAVTRKQLAHKPKAKAVYTQFQAYAQIIYEQYDPKTFEYGDVNSNGVFMGHQAYEVTYLAYSGDVEVEGYLCCCSIDKAMYVFHFCCPCDEYDSYASAIMRMRDSVVALEDEEEEE